MPAREEHLDHSPDHEIHAGHEVEFTAQSKFVVYLIMVSAFVAFLSETILTVALPTIMAELEITPATGQWLTTSYLLTMAIVIPMSGWVIQRFSTRVVFLAAMTLFALGALLAALAPGFGVLLLGRIVQAAGTGVISPLFMTTIMTLVPAHQRGKVMGNVTIVMSLAPAIGPLIGGLVVSALDWRWIFWLVLPIAIGALLVGALKLVNVTENERVPIDALSVVLSALAFGGLVYGFSGIAEWVRGVALVQPWMPLTVGAVSLLLFVLRQRSLWQRDAALLDLRVFTAHGYGLSVALMAMLMAMLFGTMILLPIYLQESVGLAPAASGLIMLPGGLLMGFAGPIVGRWFDRVGARALIIPGTIITSVAMWAMAVLLTANAPWTTALACHIVLSLGLALIFTPLFTTALGSVQPHLYSHASAMLGTSQQLSGAAGTALFIVIYTVAFSQVPGDSIAQAVGAGSHAAFIAGAVLSLGAVAIAMFIKNAPATADGVPAGH